MRGDLLSALLNLGYHRHLVDRAVDTALSGQPGTFEQVLRQALKALAR
jgi:Holliday junction resolvasome RuvABC DNA-binding subunit